MGLTISQLSFHYPHLKKENYQKWCLQMKINLESQDVWDIDIIDKGYTNSAIEENMSLNEKNVLLKKTNKINKPLLSSTSV